MKFTDVSLQPEDYIARPAKAVYAADRLLKLKSENKLWECIELIIKIWAESRRAEYQSFLVDLSETKATMRDPKFGTTKSRGSNLRRTLDVPDTVMKMIRQLYNANELPMDKAFFKKWSKKFPKMMVVERI